MPLGEAFTVLHSYEFDSKDYQVLPTTAWNYTLVVDSLTNPTNLQFEQSSYQNGRAPFNKTDIPVMISAQISQVSGSTRLINGRIDLFDKILNTN